MLFVTIWFLECIYMWSWQFVVDDSGNCEGEFDAVPDDQDHVDEIIRNVSANEIIVKEENLEVMLTVQILFSLVWHCWKS